MLDFTILAMENKHINIKISGHVQGVFFRETARKEAERLNIKGFVRNNPDGTVYIEAEGTIQQLDKFLEWCHDGPEAAQVEEVKVSKGKVKNFKGFRRDFADY